MQWAELVLYSSPALRAQSEAMPSSFGNSCSPRGLASAGSTARPPDWRSGSAPAAAPHVRLPPAPVSRRSGHFEVPQPFPFAWPILGSHLPFFLFKIFYWSIVGFLLFSKVSHPPSFHAVPPPTYRPRKFRWFAYCGHVTWVLPLNCDVCLASENVLL